MCLRGLRCVLLPSFNGARKTANLMPLVALLLARERCRCRTGNDFDSRISPLPCWTSWACLPQTAACRQAQT